MYALPDPFHGIYIFKTVDIQVRPVGGFQYGLSDFKLKSNVSAVAVTLKAAAE